MVIRKYTPEDESRLFDLIEREGEEWQSYWRGDGKAKYRKVLASSIVYVLFENESLCGYVRCRDDDGCGLYIYDLLVDQKHRGKSYGKFLMEKVCIDFPNDTVYAMSDVDPYYEKLGYEKAGTIFVVKTKG